MSLILPICNSAINPDCLAGFARSYSILDNRRTLENRLSCIDETIPFSELTKRDLHSLASQVICEYHTGETALKAKLAGMFVQKKVIAAFEMPVASSRVDFVTINGESRSFEIKSAQDNLDKLTKQVRDYAKVFDYNYIVVDKSHLCRAARIVPRNYGIMVLENGILVDQREAMLNEQLDSFEQIKLLTKREFAACFTNKKVTVDEILANFEPGEINQIFKDALKRRYKKKWAFVRSNADYILPADYQFFFYHNISPNIIYQSH